MKTVERLADVCRSKGTELVSPLMMVIRSRSTPNSSAKICFQRVLAPCPMSDVPAYAIALPS